MRHSILLLLAMTSIASADSSLTPRSARVMDPTEQLSESVVLAAVAKAGVDDCKHSDTARLLIWIVFERGKVTTVDAIGTERSLELCVKKKLRGLKIKPTVRAAATVELMTAAVAERSDPMSTTK